MATTLDQALADTVGDAVRRAAITQADLATTLGMGRVALCDRLRGRTRWAAVELAQLAAVLGVDIADLLAPVTQGAA